MGRYSQLYADSTCRSSWKRVNILKTTLFIVRTTLDLHFTWSKRDLLPTHLSGRFLHFKAKIYQVNYLRKICVAHIWKRLQYSKRVNMLISFCCIKSTLQMYIIIFTIACCHFKAKYFTIGDEGHLGNYWNDLNIPTGFITLIKHLVCSKHIMYCQDYIYQLSATLFKANNSISG